MKVRELISVLEKQDPEQDIIYNDFQLGPYSINGIEYGYVCSEIECLFLESEFDIEEELREQKIHANCICLLGAEYKYDPKNEKRRINKLV